MEKLTFELSKSGQTLMAIDEKGHHYVASTDKPQKPPKFSHNGRFWEGRFSTCFAMPINDEFNCR